MVMSPDVCQTSVSLLPLLAWRFLRPKTDSRTWASATGLCQRIWKWISWADRQFHVSRQHSVIWWLLQRWSKKMYHLASSTMHSLNRIWKDKQLSLQLKIGISHIDLLVQSSVHPPLCSWNVDFGVWRPKSIRGLSYLKSVSLWNELRCFNDIQTQICLLVVTQSESSFRVSINMIRFS